MQSGQLTEGAKLIKCWSHKDVIAVCDTETCQAAAHCLQYVVEGRAITREAVCWIC